MIIFKKVLSNLYFPFLESQQESISYYAVSVLIYATVAVKYDMIGSVFVNLCCNEVVLDAREFVCVQSTY